jgi:DNA-directed RNA polymerase specialized sigma24 family protein
MSGLDARYSRPITAVNWYGKMTRDREVEGNTHQTSPTSEDVNTYYDYHSHIHPAIGGHLLSADPYSSASNITHTALERARDNSRTFDQPPSPSAFTASIADAIHLSRLESRATSTKQNQTTSSTQQQTIPESPGRAGTAPEPKRNTSPSARKSGGRLQHLSPDRPPQRGRPQRHTATRAASWKPTLGTSCSGTPAARTARRTTGSAGGTLRVAPDV